MSGMTAVSMSEDILQVYINLLSMILQHWKKIGWLARCAGLKVMTYDNAASMSCTYGGVQRKKREVNPKSPLSTGTNHY